MYVCISVTQQHFVTSLTYTIMDWLHAVNATWRIGYRILSTSSCWKCKLQIYRRCWSQRVLFKNAKLGQVDAWPRSRDILL